ncbi:hypothetical protein DPMN_033397 [Dreissena polymorpha]|uniref:Uncharacterized protein n=1 Tax=Dreissena polymorpha TaxID=45954 RepID=A0A9D4M3Q2_DREPO|nr:hypothetical protein DPMN_033397 [Dreissena polymorpha]
MVLFNKALRQEVKGVELWVMGGEGLSWTEAPGGLTGAVRHLIHNNAHAHLKSTAPWVI